MKIIMTYKPVLALSVLLAALASGSVLANPEKNELFCDQRREG